MAAAQPAKAKASAPVAERAGAGVGGQAVAVAQVAGRRWRAAGVCSLINYPGTHDVELTFAGTGRVSYNLVSKVHLPWSDVPPEATGPLSISIGYDKTTLTLDDTVTATVQVSR